MDEKVSVTTGSCTCGVTCTTCDKNGALTYDRAESSPLRDKACTHCGSKTLRWMEG